MNITFEIPRNAFYSGARLVVQVPLEVARHEPLSGLLLVSSFLLF
jgi:hypothetical protein